MSSATRRAEEQQCAQARLAARLAWVEEVMAAWAAAHEKVDQAWSRLLKDIPDHLSDEELDAMNLPDPPEQAELDKIQAQIDAVREHDRWPKHLHWTI